MCNCLVYMLKLISHSSVTLFITRKKGPLLLRIFSIPFLSLLFVAVALCTIWGGLALYFKFPGSSGVSLGVAVAFGLFGVGTLVSFFRAVLWRWLSVFGVLFLALLLWWSTLTPPAEAIWSAEVAQQVTGRIEGDILTLENMRDFEWRSEQDFTERWITRTYDLSQLETVDLFMSYWAGPAMAHLMLSFGFSDGEYLSWSVEVRRPEGETFSPVADFFRANSLSIIAGSEKDIVGLRSNIQLADVYLFRLRSDPDRRRALLESYVNASNDLVNEPQFFHSLLTNCSRTVINLARSAGADIPIDWRVLVNGYFPSYLYELGATNTDLSFADLQATGLISESARTNGLNDNFSEAIRRGVRSAER